MRVTVTGIFVKDHRDRTFLDITGICTTQHSEGIILVPNTVHPVSAHYVNRVEGNHAQ